MGGTFGLLAGGIVVVLLLLGTQAGGRRNKRKEKKQKKPTRTATKVKKLHKQMTVVARQNGGTYRTADAVRKSKPAMRRLFRANTYTELTKGLKRASVGSTHYCILIRGITPAEARTLSELLSLETRRKLELFTDGSETIRIVVHQT